jgi:hypothetical protein
VVKVETPQLGKAVQLVSLLSDNLPIRKIEIFSRLKAVKFIVQRLSQGQTYLKKISNLEKTQDNIKISATLWRLINHKHLWVEIYQIYNTKPLATITKKLRKNQPARNFSNLCKDF